MAEKRAVRPAGQPGPGEAPADGRPAEVTPDGRPAQGATEERAAQGPADGRPQGSPPAEVAARVDALRQRIDALDEELVTLLSARAACALQVGAEKKLMGLEIYQPSREADVLAHVQRVNPGPLNDAAIKRLFERIIDEARRLEREADVKPPAPGAAHTTEE